jgi:16S rRNA processing protein RimM
MIVIGKIGSTFGVHGWLKVQPFTEYAASILEYSPWHLSSDEKTWEPITPEDGRIQGGDTVLVKLKGVDTPEAARLFTGRRIGIMREQLPALPTNQFYWSDLQDLTVINKDGTVLGKVSYMIETGSNDVLVVKGEKEIAIPFIFGKVVLSVDLAKKEIQVDWDVL